MKIFSLYIFQARIVPGIALLAPCIFFINYVIIKFNVEIIVPIVLTNIFFAVFITIIANIVRDIGKRAEEKLFAEWEGAPTTRFLRYRNDEYNKYNKERVKRYFKMRFNGIKMPTEDDERKNPEDADEKYKAYVNELRALTRIHSKNYLLPAENRNYGMWRNLWAIKIHAIVLNILIPVAAIIFRIFMPKIIDNIMLIVFLIISLVLALFWILLVTKKKIKLVSECYAKSLFETCTVLDPESNIKEQKGVNDNELND